MATVERVFKVFLLVMFVSCQLRAEWKDLKKEIRTVMRKGSLSQQQKKLEECKNYDQPEVAEYLISIVSKKTSLSAHKMTACRVLGQLKDEKSCNVLLKKCSTSSPNPLLLRAFIKTGYSGVEKVLANIILRSNDTESLTIAIRSLGRINTNNKEVIKKLYKNLDTRVDPSVRRSTVEALGGIAEKASAPILINLLKDKAVYQLAIDSLERLTGQEFGNNPGAWRNWLAKNVDFVPVNTDLDEHYAAKMAKQEKDKEDKKGTSAEFYGVEIKGQNILFILDKSGSMSAKTDYGTRLDQLKKEFSEMLDTISYKINIGIIVFPGKGIYPRSGIEEADPAYKEKLKKYLKDIQPSGGTPTGETMAYAFDKVVKKEKIDTIYLLSDGAPNTSPTQVQELIKGMNMSYFVKIHTISIGAESEFLKNVAKDNYGTYTEIK